MSVDPSRKRLIDLAAHALKRIKAREVEYEEECREDARQGYRAHYCIHGMNLWVDWDPICGYCEEGLGAYEQALSYAHNVMFKEGQRVEAMRAAVHAVRASDARLAIAELTSMLDVMGRWVEEPYEEAMRAA